MWGSSSSTAKSADNNNGNGGDETGSTQHNYYFLNRANSEKVVEVVEEIPPGSTKDEFAPKLLSPMESPAPSKRKQPESAAPAPLLPPNNPQPPAAPVPVSSRNWMSASSGFLSSLFGGGQQQHASASSRKLQATPMDNGVGTMLKIRKAPIKIEPKVFFANERTFLAWMHLSVTLAGASIAILAFAEDSNPVSQLYGVLLLPVAIAFILYSMYQYARRAYMIRNRHPGPYEDTVGPAFLGIMLMVSIVAQFALKLYAMAS